MYETSNDFENDHSIAFPFSILVQSFVRSLLPLYDNRLIIYIWGCNVHTKASFQAEHVKTC